jgi:hypothetical protein
MSYFSDPLNCWLFVRGAFWAVWAEHMMKQLESELIASGYVDDSTSTDRTPK